MPDREPTPKPRSSPTRELLGGVAVPRAVRVGIYVRTSSDENLDQTFNSLDAQEAACRAYAASRAPEGWVVAGTRYADGGFSGGNLERDGLQDLLGAIQAGLIDVVIVYKLDRLTRSIRDFAKLVDVFDRHDVRVVSVTQSIDTSNAMGKLLLHVLLSFAEFERELACERTRDKIRATRQRGVWLGGRPVLGYNGSDAGPVVVEAEASLVRSIFSSYLERRSLSAVVAELARRGVTNKSWTAKDGRALGGRPFSKSTLSKLLSNVLYTGHVPHKGAAYPGRHQAIIAPDVFQRVQHLLAENNRSGTGLTGAQHRHTPGLLRGLIFCGCCGKPLQYSTSNGDRGIVYRYLRCVTPSCATRTVPAGEMEKFVIAKVRGTFHDAGLVTRVFDMVRARAHERVLDLEAQRGILVEELCASEKLLSAGDGPARVEAAARHAEAGTTLASVEKALAEARAALVDRATVEAGLREFDGLWACLSPGERAQLIGSVVERITYDGKKGEVAITRREGTTGVPPAAPSKETAA